MTEENITMSEPTTPAPDLDAIRERYRSAKLGLVSSRIKLVRDDLPVLLAELERLVAVVEQVSTERDEARTECTSAHNLLDEQFTKLKALGEQISELEAELADWRETPPEAMQSKTERDLRASLSTLAEQNWRLINNRNAKAASLDRLYGSVESLAEAWKAKATTAITAPSRAIYREASLATRALLGADPTPEATT